MNITPGTVFSTKLPDGEIIETGCVAQSAPDEFGNFDGIDSDGVEVTFNTRMVAQVGVSWDADLKGTIYEEARYWLLDCGADPSDVADATDESVKQEVERHFEGGWNAFYESVVL